jgi:small subunit ribosomal protein S7
MELNLNKHSMQDISKLSRLFSNRLMKNGKKSLSDKFVKQVLLELKLSKESPREVLALAVLNAGPLVCVKNVKSRGKTFQVPFPLTPKQQVSKGFDQILANTSPNTSNIAAELLNASTNKGKSIKSRRLVHQTARNNRAFVGYRWF